MILITPPPYYLSSFGQYVTYKIKVTILLPTYVCSCVFILNLVHHSSRYQNQHVTIHSHEFFSILQVKKIQTEREMNTMSNRSLAEYNLRQGERLAECKSRLVHLYEELNKQTKIFDENKSNLGAYTFFLSLHK